MRKKLTLKPKTSPVINEGRSTEERRTSEVNMGCGDVTEDPDVPQCSADVVQDIVLSQAKARKILQRGSPMKLVSIYPSMSKYQKAMIRAADYGGLLEIKCSKLQPELCKFLMESVDPTSCSMVFPGRGAIPITESSVKKVLGVPRGKLEVKYEVKPEATKFMLAQFGNGGRKQPTITFLKKKLLSMKNADNKYLRLFITYGMCSVLAPTTAVRISPRLYPSMINIKQAKDLNVCKFVITMIKKATKSKAEKAIMKACMLYLMVKYLDSLQLEDMDISVEGTRVSVWTNALVKKAIEQDTGPDGSFGMAPLKPKYAYICTPEVEQHMGSRLPEVEEQEEGEEIATGIFPEEQGQEYDEEKSNSNHPEVHCQDSEETQGQEGQGAYAEGQSILFTDTRRIEEFIEIHAPTGRTPEDTARYKEAIQYACENFESGLKVLVKNLPPGPTKQHSCTERSNKVRPEEISEDHPKASRDKCNRKVGVAGAKDVQEQHHLDVESECVKSDDVVMSEQKQGAQISRAGCSNQARNEDLFTPSKVATPPIDCNQEASEDTNAQDAFDFANKEVILEEKQEPKLSSVQTFLKDFAFHKAKHDDLKKMATQQGDSRKPYKSAMKQGVNITSDSADSPPYTPGGTCDEVDDAFEDEFMISSEDRRAKLMDYCLHPSPAPKIDHLVIEPHEIIDIDLGLPSPGKLMHELVKSMPRPSIEEAGKGLESLTDGPFGKIAANSFVLHVPKQEMKN